MCGARGGGGPGGPVKVVPSIYTAGISGAVHCAVYCALVAPTVFGRKTTATKERQCCENLERKGGGRRWVTATVDRPGGGRWGGPHTRHAIPHRVALLATASLLQDPQTRLLAFESKGKSIGRELGAGAGRGRVTSLPCHQGRRRARWANVRRGHRPGRWLWIGRRRRWRRGARQLHLDKLELWR